MAGGSNSKATEDGASEGEPAAGAGGEAALTTNPGFDPESVAMTSSFWFSEDVTDDMVTKFRLNNIMYNGKSQFQRIQVIDCAPFGKTLVLDGKSQSAAGDEFVYHEALVHPAMLLHGNPKRVFIGGGGEGATAREMLRHRSVEKCIMVDLDKMVVDVSKDKLPEWGAGCWDDDRLEVYYQDAHAWLRDYKGPPFDVICMDIADPIEAGPGYVLYTEEFYRYATTQLAEGGIIVTQSGPGSLNTHEECFTVIHRTLASAFKHAVPYTVDVPSFGCTWAFTLAFNACAGAADAAAVVEMSVAATDAAIAARIGGGGSSGSSALRFYDGAAHLGMFGTPKWLRRALDAERRVMTVDNPVFMI
ncbi:S-adenosyl-L-methionine-dependent methyltransferase [Tribonema minus]|uniref:thermospermine synthase n=1 Tax=Tribonema minus TaxID=303371 RepID=A0A836C836_9STRA|nr:S-adenosyl-L-methionine-dependent methyltransferase [Tribonema minus]